MAFGTFLFLVMEGQRPLAGSARYDLRDVVEVTIGRGAARSAVRKPLAGGVGLTVRVPDKLMSGVHLRLSRSEGGWLLEDLGSTNGTLLDGDPVERVELGARAVISAGAAHFIFHTALPVPAGEPVSDVDTESAPAESQGITTVMPFYAAKLRDFGKIAGSSVPVLLLGETGTGKEVLARALHRLSERAGAFVAVNCGALPQALVESQLFGHVRGAFSGALRDEPGLVRSADGGTLFLDEIGDLQQASQAALLRVLQEREVLPVGATRALPVDLRVVAATHHAIGRIGGSEFRADLFARLSGYTLRLPALRDRKEDLGILVGDLLTRIAPGKQLQLSAAAGLALITYGWPLNVRELEQALSVAAVLTEGVIEVSHLPAAFSGSAATASDVPDASGSEPAVAELPPEQEELRARLVATLQVHRGNVTDVARALGRTRMQVHRWMKRFGIDADAYRS